MIGGGHKHRMSLNEMIMIKDNHLMVSNSMEDIIKNAEFVIHPECSCTTPMMHDVASGRYKNHQVQILSTEGMMNHVSKSDSQQFVVATETGILYRMRQQNPQKTFIPASENAECEYMKMITLDKVYRSLYDEKYEVKVAKKTADKARLAIERMLSIS